MLSLINHRGDWSKETSGFMNYGFTVKMARHTPEGSKLYVVRKYLIILAFLIQGADLQSFRVLLSKLMLIFLNLFQLLTTESNFLK